MALLQLICATSEFSGINTGKRRKADLIIGLLRNWAMVYQLLIRNVWNKRVVIFASISPLITEQLRQIQ